MTIQLKDKVRSTFIFRIVEFLFQVFWPRRIAIIDVKIPIQTGKDQTAILKSEVRSDTRECIVGVWAYRQYTEWESLRVWNSIWFLLPLDPRRRNRRWVEREGPGGGGGPPPQKRGCSQGRATDPTSCRIQPLILPITNSTTLSLFARFGLRMIPATSRLFQLHRRQCTFS